jgi:DNA invertase Pin-like site-specific DNA recombinase
VILKIILRRLLNTILRKMTHDNHTPGDAVPSTALTELPERPASTPGGRLVFHLFGALGQFEKDLIQERTRAGLVAAAARGRKGGRKPVITGDKLERARAIIGKGLTVREAAVRIKVGKTALYEALRE